MNKKDQYFLYCVSLTNKQGETVKVCHQCNFTKDHEDFFDVEQLFSPEGEDEALKEEALMYAQDDHLFSLIDQSLEPFVDPDQEK